MQSTPIFLDITKVADFGWKNAVSRTQGVCHVIDIYLYLLEARYHCAKFHHCRIRVTDFREGAFFPSPSVSRHEKVSQNRVKGVAQQ